MVTVIHAGVDVTMPAGTPPILSPDRLPVIGTAGPLEPAKGHVYFLGPPNAWWPIGPTRSSSSPAPGPKNKTSAGWHENWAWPSM